MKKIIIYLICLLSLFGCSKNNDEVVYHNAYNNIAENDIFQIETCFVISGNISNPSYVDSISTDIALITILSIDGGDNFGEQTNEYCYPYTYGKFKVEKVYKGNIEEEKEYVTRWEQGDREARNVLIEHNLRLVAYLVKKYSNSDYSIDDLISIGTIGLIKAVDTYRQGKGVRLATYASRCIDNAIQSVG